MIFWTVAVLVSLYLRTAREMNAYLWGAINRHLLIATMSASVTTLELTAALTAKFPVRHVVADTMKSFTQIESVIIYGIPEKHWMSRGAIKTRTKSPGTEQQGKSGRKVAAPPPLNLLYFLRPR